MFIVVAAQRCYLCVPVTMRVWASVRLLFGCVVILCVHSGVAVDDDGQNTTASRSVSLLWD